MSELDFKKKNIPFSEHAGLFVRRWCGPLGVGERDVHQASSGNVVDGRNKRIPIDRADLRGGVGVDRPTQQTSCSVRWARWLV